MTKVVDCQRVHIVLGKRNFRYRKDDVYRKIEGEKLLKEILNLVEKYKHLIKKTVNMIFTTRCFSS